MAKSYQDRGYGTTIDNYNAQKKKQAPISTLRAEQIQKQNQQKQNTSAPVSTVRTEQNYSTARSRADSAYRPHQVNTSKSTAAGKVTANEFARSTGLKNTYGSYANYLLDRPVTGGGYYTFGDAVSSRKMAHQAEQLGRYEDAVGLLRDNLDKAQKNAEDVFGGEEEFNRLADNIVRRESNLKYLAHQMNTGAISKEQYDAAYNSYEDAFNKSLDVYRRETSYAAKAKKAAAIGEYDKALNSYNKMVNGYKGLANAYEANLLATQKTDDRRRKLVREIPDIQAEMDGILKENEEYYKLRNEKGGGNIAATIQGNQLRANGAEKLQQAWNDMDEVKRIDKLIEANNQRLALCQEELEWAQHYKWHDIAYDSMPASAWNRNGMKTELIEKVIQGKATPEEQQQAIQELNFSANNAAEMSDYERKTFASINQKYGFEKAMEYYNELENISLNTRRRASDEQMIYDIMDSSTGAYVGMQALSVLAKPAQLLSHVGQTAEMLLNGEMTKDASYNAFTYMNNAVRNKTSQDIMDKMGDTWGKWGAFGYQTAMSIADFLYNAAITGNFGGPLKGTKLAENMSLLLMSSEAAADATMQGLDRGLSSGEAYGLGIVAGAAEYVTEKVSLENLLDKVSASGGAKERLWYLLKNRLAEASEEGASDMINLFFDILVTKDRSEWAQSVRKYEMQGMTANQAFIQAVTDQAEETGMSMLGGWLSGAAMANVSLAFGDVKNMYHNAKNLTGKQNIDELIGRGFSLKEGSAGYTAAQQLQEKRDAGKNIRLSEVLRANKAIDTELRTDRKYIGKQIQRGQTYAGTEAFDLATEMRDKLDKGGKVSLREVNNLESAISDAAATDPKTLTGLIEQGKLCDKGTDAYDAVMEIQEAIDKGARPSVKAVRKAQDLVLSEAMKDLDSDAAERVGRRLATEGFRGVLEGALTVLESTKSDKYGTMAAEVREQIRTGNIDAKTAGEAFLTAEKLKARAREVQANKRTLTPREVTEDMDEYDRSAVEIGIDETEAAEVKAVAKALGVDVRWYAKEAAINPKSGKMRTENGYHENGVLYLNAHSTNPVMTVVAHEMTHALQGTESWNSLKDLILSKDPDFRREEIESAYADKNLDPKRFEQEQIARYVEEKLLTDEAAIREAVNRDRSFGQWMRDRLDDLLAKLGNENARERQFLRKARDLYAKALQEYEGPKDLELPSVKENPATEGGEAQYSISVLPDGRKYVDVDVDQHLFDGLSLSEMRKVARTEILKRFRGKTIGGENAAYVNRESAKHYAHPANKRVAKDILTDKMRASPELDNILEASVYRGNVPDDGRHPNATGGWDKYDTLFRVGGKLYTGEISVMVTDNGPIFYDLTKMKEDTTGRVNGQTQKRAAASTDDVSAGTVSQNQSDVKKVSLPKVDGQNSITEEENGLRLPRVRQEQTETESFKRWFGDWQNDPQNASKVVNEDGTPKVMYRGDAENFTVFDRKKAKGSGLYGRGFYFTDSEAHARQYGKPRAFYLDVKNPLSPGQNEITRAQMRNFLQAVAENEDEYDLQNYGYGATAESVLDQVYGKGDFEMIQDVNATAIGDLVAAVELFNRVNGTDYDGIITDTETVTFQSTQNKSATDNIGTFDRNNPDVNYSITEEEAGLELPRVEETAGETEAKQTEQKEKKETKPVAKSKPIDARRWLNRQTIDKFGIPEGMRKTASQAVQMYADKMLNNGQVTEKDLSDLFHALLENGVVDVFPDDWSRTLRDMVTGGMIHTDDSIRADFGDDWGDFKKRAFAAGLLFTNASPNEKADSRGIDSIYQELSDMAPGLFPADVHDPRTMLETIVNVAEQGKKKRMSLPEYLAYMDKTEGMDMYEAADRMMEDLAADLKTFGEMANLELKLRDRTGKKIMQERERFGQIREKEFKKAADIRRQERQRYSDTFRKMRQQKQLRELQEKTLRQLKWMRQNQHRAPADMKAEWADLVSDMDTYAINVASETQYSKKLNATYGDVVAMANEAMAKNPNWQPTSEMKRILTRIESGHIGDMDIDQLQDYYNALRALRAEFYQRNNAILGDELEAFSDIYADTRAGMLANARRVRTLFDKEFMTPVNLLKSLVGWDPNNRFNEMIKDLENSEKRMRDYTVRSNRLLDEFKLNNKKWLATADGQGRRGQWIEAEVPVYDWRDGEAFATGEMQKVYMTPLQRVHLYLESKGYANMLHITSGRTFVDKDLYSKGKKSAAYEGGTTVSLSEQTVKELLKDMSPEEKELAKILEHYYNEFSRPYVNETSNRIWGYDKAIGGYYAPIISDPDFTRQEIGVGDQTAKSVGNMKARIPNAKNATLNISALDAFERSVQQTAKFYGFAATERNWNMFKNWQSGSTSFKKTLGEAFKGAEIGKYIDDLISELQGNTERPKHEAIDAFVNRLLGNYVGATFAMNPGITLKQAASFPTFATVLGWGTMPSAARIAKVNEDLINTYTSELAYRKLGYATPETAQVADNPSVLQTNKAMNFLLSGGMIVAMDAATVKAGWAWAENYVRKNFPELEKGTPAQIEAGKSEYYKKVAEVWEDAVGTTQPMYDIMHRADIMRSKSTVTRAFTMFRTVPFQMYNALRRSFGEYSYAAEQYKNNKTAENRQALRQAAGRKATAITATVVSNLALEAIEFLNALWKNRGKKYRDDDDELTAESVAMEIGAKMVSDTAMVPVVKELTEMLENAFMGKKWYGIELPGGEQLNEFIDTIRNGGEKIYNFISGAIDVHANGEDFGQYLKRHAGEYAGALKDTIEGLAKYLGGLPLENLEKYIMGAVQFSPELTAAVEDVFSNVKKSQLNGLSGKQLKQKLGDLLDVRGISASDETMDELARLYEGGYKTSVPADAPDKLTVNDDEVKLSEGQTQKWERVWGETASSALNDLIKSKEYQNADDDGKKAMLDKLYAMAKDAANKAVFPDWTDDQKWKKQADELRKQGATLAQAAAWESVATSGSDAEKFQWLANTNWSDDLKETCFKLEKGEETEEDDGDPTAYGKLKLAKERGASVTTYLKWLGEIGGKNTAERYSTLARLKLTDKEKEALLPFVSKTVTTNGIESATADWEYVKDKGMSIDTYLRWKSTKAAIGSNPSQEKCMTTLAKIGTMSDKDKIAITGTLFDNRNTLSSNGELTSYGEFQEMIKDGVKINDYLEVKASNAIPEYRKAIKAGLKVEYAVSTAKTAHEVKARVVEARKAKGLDSGDWLDYCEEALKIKDGNERLAAISALMDTSDWDKCKACMNLVDPEYYIEAQLSWKNLLAQYPDMTKKQVYVKMAIDKVNCSNEKKAILFQMFNKGWGSANNPYSSSAGDQALQAMQAGKYKPEVDEGELQLPVID